MTEEVRGCRRIIPALAGNTAVISMAATHPTDHPRSRGEYRAARVGAGPGIGSSPLSRGIRIPTHRGGSTFGIIPALAGNTVVEVQPADHHTDHPRSRGEYWVWRCCLAREDGSSPLSRGIHPTLVPPAARHRIIPALAGNTSMCSSIRAQVSDHPRSRGEYADKPGRVGEAAGSSPLSRGILGHKNIEGRLQRIIPALAGNTLTSRGESEKPPDHPRSRGEYPDSCRSSFILVGSSPLSRGILEVIRCWTPIGRIIPALAGNTYPLYTHPARHTDHPRSRGEYHPVAPPPKKHSGSSPLSRGIPIGAGQPRPCKGIIPALAGNTAPSRLLQRQKRDHPRSRGEY